MEVPNWATDNNLRANGLYYEGFVDDLESVLDYHKVVTVSTYGTRKSRKGAGLANNHIEGKENESPDKQKREQEEVIYINLITSLVTNCCNVCANRLDYIGAKRKATSYLSLMVYLSQLVM